MKRVVTIGGGTGHSQVLKGIKHISDIAITAICPCTDSGGSTGILQKEYGGRGYVGDLTKCVAALTPNHTLAKALNHRFGSGTLSGHSMKNILFHALEAESDLDTALSLLWHMTGLGPHKVIPVSEHVAELCATLWLGTTISGETTIDTLARNPLWNAEVHAITDIFLKPSINASTYALGAIRDADAIVICPGDLYSSTIPVLLPQGMKESITQSHAPITIVLNVMTKSGETDKYTATDFVHTIERFLGRPANHIICNNAPIPEHILLKYSLERKVEMVDLVDNDARITFAPIATVNDDDQVISDPAELRRALEPLITV